MVERYVDIEYRDGKKYRFLNVEDRYQTDKGEPLVKIFCTGFNNERVIHIIPLAVVREIVDVVKDKGEA